MFGLNKWKTSVAISRAGKDKGDAGGVFGGEVQLSGVPFWVCGI